MMEGEGLMLCGVGLSFGHITALEAIDIKLPSRGVIVFVGANGSGKSTLLDILSGFIRHWRGKICSETTKRRLDRHHLIRRVARLHQRLVVPPKLSARVFLDTIRRQLSLSCLLSLTRSIHSGDSNLSEVLRAAQLINKLDEPLGALSYGQQRAVALEAVLATRKPFVALDEPLAGLDARVRGSIVTRIRQEGRNRCVIVAEHDLPGALDVADRILVLRLGAVVADLPAAGITAADLMAKF